MRCALQGLAVLLLVLTLALGSSGNPASAQGNSEAAHFCQEFVQDDESPSPLFKNVGQCVSFLAQGGQLSPCLIDPDTCVIE